jgi:hypothetical protein
MTCSQGPTPPNIWPPKAGTTLVISIRVVRASDGTAQRVTIVKKPPTTAVPLCSLTPYTFTPNGRSRINAS